MALLDKDRAKLDGIVQKMQANGESDDYIQGVVNDFKSKYDAKPQTTGQALKQGASESFHPLDAIASIPGAIVDSIKNLPNRFNPDSAENKAGFDEANQMFDLKGADADKYVARKLGNKIGGAAEQAVIGAATYGAGKALGAAGKVIPRGVGKTVGEQIGEQEAILDAKGALKNDHVDKMISEVQNLRAENMANNGVVIDAAKDSRLAKVEKQLTDMRDAGKPRTVQSSILGPDGKPVETEIPGQQVNYSSVNRLKRNLQEEAKASGEYGTSPKSKSKGVAAKESASEVRSILRDVDGADAINALNDKFARIQRAADIGGKMGAVLGAPVGAAKGLVGGLTGAVTGLELGAKGGSMVGRNLTRAILDGSVRKASAPIRNAIADAMTYGDYATADKIAAGLLVSGKSSK